MDKLYFKLFKSIHTIVTKKRQKINQSKDIFSILFLLLNIERTKELFIEKGEIDINQGS